MNLGKKKPEVIIPYTSFPDDNATDSQKASPEFGLQVGQAISYQWFNREGNTCQYYSRRAEFRRRRLYAAAMQPIGKYKQLIGVDGDTSHVAYDFTPISIIPKFVDIVANGMGDRQMAIRAFSQDVVSAEKRSKKQEMIEADMIAKPFLQSTQDQFGVDAFNVEPDKLPEDNDELDLHMNLNYKPAIEIAEEIAIDTVLLENHYDDIETRSDRDIVVCGLGVQKNEFVPGEGIRASYVDAEEWIHSYTEDPFFKDCFYFGEPKNMHVNELYKINPNITPEKVAEITQFAGSWYNYYNGYREYGFFQKDVVTLLYFNYKTTKHFKYKRKKTKKGGEKAILKDGDFNAEDNELFETSTIPKEVWYEGIMILGTNELLKWELAENMVRPKSTSQHAMPMYAACAPDMVKGVINSTVARMIPFADQIQLTHLKLQQIKSKMVPDGVWIDIDGINNINLGNGNTYSPEDALKLYFETGSAFGRSVNEDGEFNNARQPIIELNKSAPQGKMSALMADYNFQLNMIRDVTGLNEARDASTPDPKSLVGLQKLAALNSNTATRHILRAKMYLKRTMAESISLRIADVLQYSDMAKDFSMRIGKYNLEVLREIKDLYLYDFGIFIELAPDEEEKQMLEQNIQACLVEQTITLEDAIDIRMIRNVKQANEMLKVKRRKREREKQDREDVIMQQQALINQDAQAVAAQAAIDKINAEANAKIMVEQKKSEFAIQTETATAQLKSGLMAEEFGYAMQLKGIEVEGQTRKQEMAEDRKDKRTELQATQQSKLIDQRRKDLPPTNFESNNDSMMAIDLSDFEPR
jgi:hypothetical protein